MKLLVEYDMKVVANDKEPGYTLMKKEVFVEELAKILKTDAYQPRSDAYWKSSDADATYIKYTQMAEKVTGQFGIGASMRRSMHVKNSRATAIIKLQCKSHKELGVVSFRNLHAAARWRYAGLSLWLSNILSERLKVLAPHIVASTQAVVDVLRTYPTPLHPDATMVRVHMEEFFMSGCPRELTEGISTRFEDSDLGRFVEDAGNWMLSIQMVRCDEICGQWAVVRGSGMGLPHNGALVDCAFWLRAEHNFTDDTNIVSSSGILLYKRIKDDAFFLVNDRPTFRAFYEKFKARAAPTFRMKCVEVSRVAVTMLAVTVRIRDGRFATELRDRRAQGPPLGFDSARPPSVLRSWAVGYMSSFPKLVSPAALRSTCESFVPFCSLSVWGRLRSAPAAQSRGVAHV